MGSVSSYTTGNSGERVVPIAEEAVLTLRYQARIIKSSASVRTFEQRRLALYIFKIREDAFMVVELSLSRGIQMVGRSSK